VDDADRPLLSGKRIALSSLNREWPEQENCEGEETLVPIRRRI